MATFSIKNKTQVEIREHIVAQLHVAAAALAETATWLPALTDHQGFISLAKVNADNLATMVSNLETRLKYPV